jgi:hypothetical protein
MTLIYPEWVARRPANSRGFSFHLVSVSSLMALFRGFSSQSSIMPLPASNSHLNTSPLIPPCVFFSFSTLFHTFCYNLCEPFDMWLYIFNPCSFTSLTPSHLPQDIEAIKVKANFVERSCRCYSISFIPWPSLICLSPRVHVPPSGTRTPHARLNNLCFSLVSVDPGLT